MLLLTYHRIFTTSLSIFKINSKRKSKLTTGQLRRFGKSPLIAPEAKEVEVIKVKKSAKSSKTAKSSAKSGGKKAKMEAGTDTWM